MARRRDVSVYRLIGTSAADALLAAVKETGQ
jgi:hypothetical protein